MAKGETRPTVSEKAGPTGARLVDSSLLHVKTPDALSPDAKRWLTMTANQTGRDDDPASRALTYKKGESYLVGPDLHRVFVEVLAVAKDGKDEPDNLGTPEVETSEPVVAVDKPKAESRDTKVVPQRRGR